MADYKETIARLRAEKKKLQGDLKTARTAGASKKTKEAKARIKTTKNQLQSERTAAVQRRQARRAAK
jgi:hypothetical protein